MALRRRHEPGGRRELQGWLWMLGLGLSMPLWAGPMWGRIGWEAHLGGLVAGMLVAFCWAAVSPRKAGLRTGLAAAVGGLGLALVLAGAPLGVDTVEAGWVADEEPGTERERTALLHAALGPEIMVSGAPRRARASSSMSGRWASSTTRT